MKIQVIGYDTKKKLNTNYFYFSKQEQNEILKISESLIESDEQESKTELIYISVYNYILENKSMILDGFVNFRLKDYMEIFYSNDRYMGGCIWEWSEHAMTVSDGDTKFYGYGGDFGDKVSYKNICVDGVCSPDRRARSAMLEMKNIYLSKGAKI